LPADVLEELKPFLDREGVPPPLPDEKQSTFRDVVRTIAAAVVAVVLSAFLMVNYFATRTEIKQSEAHEYYEAGAHWMRYNISPGELIFNTDWDDFPRLFYFDPMHYYVSGLDPSYLYDKNPDLSRLYDRITLGEEQDPGPLIRERFGARYVFTDNTHHDFIEHARDSGWFDVVYEDVQCTIMYIRDQKLEENPLGGPDE
jgi:hypothetical protein